MSNSSDPMDCSPPASSVRGIFQARVLEWDSIAFTKNTGVGCHSLLQEIFPTQGLNPALPHCRQTLYCLSHQGSPLGMHRGGANWETGIDIYTLLCIKHVNNENLLYSTGNSTPVQFSYTVMSYSLQPHGLQHARPPCSSPTPRVYLNSHPLSW